ncbi:hypothetical protein AZE42_10633 [Rhizopogon vesiculosus]|uniref:Uncharacterized protein n=1 Tax=Rhizopogon vesiculosus TaxID=180088 RepID=A0A1J8QYT1_9AGAM|nr:hypothetical protein AZE42_10633 [Rhizopogon vesiculosus]
MSKTPSGSRERLFPYTIFPEDELDNHGVLEDFPRETYDVVHIKIKVYFSQRMLELSHISRRRSIAQQQYQHLHAEELQLTISFLKDEGEESRAYSQIGRDDLELRDCIPEMLRTSFTCKRTREAKGYFAQRILELSRVGRRTIIAKMNYQRLRTEELQLTISIMEDEAEELQVRLTAIGYNETVAGRKFKLSSRGVNEADAGDDSDSASESSIESDSEYADNSSHD